MRVIAGKARRLPLVSPEGRGTRPTTDRIKETLFNILQDEDARCFDFDIMQGEAIKRDGTMHVHVEKEHGTPKLVQITGNAVIAFSTEITI